MADATVDILLNEPVGTIRPEVYGHFMEHLGGCVAGGCWVGEDSSITNTGGIRDDVVEALWAVRPPVIRWPGGCFADDYDWEDGVGPRGDRPVRVNFHWGDALEDNQFGTHEFMAFCRAVGAQPYLSGNVGSGTPRQMRNWMEYCNYPGESALSRRRAQNGSPEPFGVRYWGVGNEAWGCGGHFTPEDYATEYRRFATFLRKWGDEEPFLIACGPSNNDLDWTRRFFTKLRADFGRGPCIHGFAAHYYVWNPEGPFGSATEYDEGQWYGLLAKAIGMEALVTQQRALMDAFDPERKIGLIVDEWGTWHPASPDAGPSRVLWQQNTTRDALVAALTLDIFNRHADKVVMANIAQTINVLQALLMTFEDRLVRTPTWHTFDLYAPHQGGRSVRLLCEGPAVDADVVGSPVSMPLVSGSASVKDGRLTLTLVNAHATEAREVEVRLSGGRCAPAGPGAALHSEAGGIHAHNTVDSPDNVRLGPAADPVPEANGTILRVTLPAASAARWTLSLG